MGAPTIRPVRPDELATLRGTERRAGALFRAVGLAEAADDEPLAVAQLEAFRRDGRAGVAVLGDAVAGYVLVSEIDAGAHVHQVSVDPAHGRRGIGRALLDEVARWAADRGLEAVTLTTYAEVPWNAPDYRRLGFEAIAPGRAGRPRLSYRTARWTRARISPPTR